MSSPSPSKPADAAAADAEHSIPNDQDLNVFLKEKDAEIKTLKEEIQTYKQTIAWQHKELQKHNASKKPVAAAALAAVDGIAKESLKNMNDSGSSKAEERWKNRFQQLVAYKLEVRKQQECCSSLVIHGILT
jgi:hypothetical protein